MKRFVTLMLLLLLTLLIARAAQAAHEVDVDLGHDGGPTTERANFFDHRVSARSPLRLGWNSPSADAPRRVEDAVEFRYRDRGYTGVWLAGEASGELPLAMELDVASGRWVARVPLGPGRYRYWFEVEDADGVRRERTDPANPERRRDAEVGWVSELRVSATGRVVIGGTREERRARRDEHYDLDLLAEGGAHYQRADGLLLSARPRFESSAPLAPVLEGWIGYGFSSERWGGQATLFQPLRADRGLRMVVSAYDRTDYTDRTGMGDAENSLATLIFREDGRDWFRREGLSLALEAELGGTLLARVEVRSDVHRTTPRRVIAGWGGRGDFLPMLPIDEGLMRSLFARVRFGTDLDHLWLEFEHADDAWLPTELEFTQLTAQARKRMRMGRQQYLDLRLRFGTGLGDALPQQKRYLAGGIGTIRGFGYQSVLVPDADVVGVGGERMLLANAEYVMGVESDVALALFVDSGNVWADRHADVFDEDWKTSVGLGVLLDADTDDALRLDLIKPLDSGSGFVVQARLRRPF